MVFTIEPGIYIPEEKLGVRIECDFLVLPDGKLLDLDAEPAAHRRRSRSGDAESSSDVHGHDCATQWNLSNWIC